MEFIGDCNGLVKTVYSARTKNELPQEAWNNICFQLTEAVKYMHYKRILHNDLKSNNVLLKFSNQTYYPVVVDMGKATLRSNPEVNKLTESQEERYNKKHTHLAFELRNRYGATTSFETDVYSLGVIFNFVADKENSLLGYLKSGMLLENPSKRLKTPQILRHFYGWKTSRVPADGITAALTSIKILVVYQN